MKRKKALQSKESIFSSELTQRLLPQKMVFTPCGIEQSDFFRQVLLVKSFPSYIESDFLLTAAAQIKNTTVSFRLTPMDPQKTVDLVDKQINNMVAQSHERKGTRQIAAGVDVESIRESYQEFVRDKGRFYFVNIYIEVYASNEDELKQRVSAVNVAFTSSHVSTQTLAYEQKEGYLGVSPIGKDTLFVSANNIPSTTLASFYPFSYSSRNDPEGMHLGNTKDGGHMFLDLWLRSQNITSGNFILIGETGYGKSYLLKKIISQQIARGTWVFCIDVESEYCDLFIGIGGTNINCASGRFRINPYDIRRLKSDEDDEDELDAEIDAFQQDQSFFQHLSWLRDFYRVLFPHIDSRELSALSMLTKDMYNQHGIDQFTDLSRLKSEDYPTFSDLYYYVETVQEDRKKYSFYDKVMDEAMLRNLLLLLRDVYDGSLSPLFNGHTNVINAKQINFNIQELLAGSEERTQAFLFNIMTYLWDKIMKKENRILFCIDELYLLMNRDSLTIAKYLRNFIKRARKYESVIGTATQQLIDLDDEKIRHISSAIINSATFKFLFNPGDLAFERTKSVLQLTEGEAQSIFTAEKAQCLLKAGRDDKYNVHVGELPFEKKLFGKGGGR